MTHPNTPDGPKHKYEKQRRWDAAHREEIAEARRKRNVAHPELRRAIRKRYEAAHKVERAEYRAAYRAHSPEKIQARTMVSEAVSLGRMSRQPCEICGADRAQAHHPFGYDRAMALAVWWLCRTHHSGIHVAMKAN